MMLILFIGILGVFLVFIFKRKIIEMVGTDFRLMKKLKNAKWFQNHWLSGLFLFIMNAVLFFSTVLALFFMSKLVIPYLHLLVMLLAVVGSIYLWIIINKAWNGAKKDRLKMGFVGSSFYLLTTFIFVYMIVTLKPSYPGEDTFMAAIGLVFAIIVSTIAFILCFGITGIPNNKVTN